MAKAEARSRRQVHAEHLEKCRLMQNLVASRVPTHFRDRAEHERKPRTKDDRLQFPMRNGPVEGRGAQAQQRDEFWGRDKTNAISDVLLHLLPLSKPQYTSSYLQSDGSEERHGSSGCVSCAESNSLVDTDHTKDSSSVEDEFEDELHDVAAADECARKMFSKQKHLMQSSSNFQPESWTREAEANSLLQTSNELAVALLENASKSRKKPHILEGRDLASPSTRRDFASVIIPSKFYILFES